MSETEKLLEEALPCVVYSVNKWAERACAITQKGFRFPSGSEPTKEQINETFAKWQKMEELAKKITNRLAKRDVVDVPREPEVLSTWRIIRAKTKGGLSNQAEQVVAYVDELQRLLRAAQEGK